MLNSFKIAIFALLLSGVLFAAVWGSGILYAMWRPSGIQLPDAVELLPAERIPAGGDAVLTFEAELPANREIAKVTLEPGKNVAVVRDIVWKRKKWLWNRNRFAFSALLRPLGSGEIAEGKVTLSLTPSGKKHTPDEFNIAIPAFTSEIPAGEESGGELKFSAAIPEPSPSAAALTRHFARYKYIYMVLAVIIAVAGFFIIRHLLRRPPAPLLPCWEIALAALASLRDQLSRGELLPRAGYTELMDILRNYLELRFRLPVSRRTTEEFLAELSRPETPLPEQYRTKLAKFLNSVELIRFAKAPATQAELDEAAGLLTGFVKATIPAETGTENNS